MFVPKTKDKARRYYEDILYEIIDLCKEGCVKTQIMYRCNLSFDQLNDYLKKVQNTNFLTFDGKKYNATEKGKVFTHVYSLLNTLSTTGKDKDPYADSELKDLIQTTLSSLNSVNNSLESLRFKKVYSFTGENRTKYSILEDITNAAADGIRKTGIMNVCNLSFNQTKKYLELTKNANLTKLEKHEGKTNFLTTDKGKMFSQLHRLMTYLTETGNDEDPFKDDERIKKIEVALAPVISVKVPKEAYFVIDE